MVVHRVQVLFSKVQCFVEVTTITMNQTSPAPSAIRSMHMVQYLALEYLYNCTGVPGMTTGTVLASRCLQKLQLRARTLRTTNPCSRVYLGPGTSGKWQFEYSVHVLSLILELVSTRSTVNWKGTAMGKPSTSTWYARGRVRVQIRVTCFRVKYSDYQYESTAVHIYA